MEIWDLYNEKREIIGEHIRGTALPENGFHVVVHVWIKNSAGKYLMAQRSANRRTFPLRWECVGGSALKGENSVQSAVREVKEESQENKLVYSIKDLSYFFDEIEP